MGFMRRHLAMMFLWAGKFEISRVKHVEAIVEGNLVFCEAIGEF
jgi:hypothetical protein